MSDDQTLTDAEQAALTLAALRQQAPPTPERPEIAKPSKPRAAKQDKPHTRLPVPGHVKRGRGRPRKDASVNPAPDPPLSDGTMRQASHHVAVTGDTPDLKVLPLLEGGSSDSGGGDSKKIAEENPGLYSSDDREEFPVTFEFQPKQVEVWEAFQQRHGATRVGYGGSRGSAKSHLGRNLCLGLVLQHENTTAWIIRRTLDDIRDNHIDPMLREHPWLDEFYRKQEKTIYLPGGRKIRFISCDTPDVIFRLAGKEATWIFIDQAEQFTQEEIEFSYTLCRWTVNQDITPRMLLTFNPGGPGNAYLKRVFVNGAGKGEKNLYEEREHPEDYKFFMARAWDNIKWVERYLMVEGIDPRDYYNVWTEDQRFDAFLKYSDYGKTLDQLPDAKRKAQLFGDFESWIGQFFTEWREKYHVLKHPPTEIPEGVSIGASIDYGRRCCMYIGYRGKEPLTGVDTITLVSETWTEDLVPADNGAKFADAIEKWGFCMDIPGKGIRPLTIVYDTNMGNSNEYFGYDKSILAQVEEVFKKRFGKHAPTMVRVTKRSEHGKRYRVLANEAVRSFLAWKVDEKGALVQPPRLQVSPHCAMLRKTLPELQYPEKERSDGLDFDQNIGCDDAVDSAKYLILYLDEPLKAPDVQPPRNEAEFMQRVFAQIVAKNTIGMNTNADAI